MVALWGISEIDERVQSEMTTKIKFAQIFESQTINGFEIISATIKECCAGNYRNSEIE